MQLLEVSGAVRPLLWVVRRQTVNPFSPISLLIPSAQVTLGLPRFLLLGGLHFITCFGNPPLPFLFISLISIVISSHDPPKWSPFYQKVVSFPCMLNTPPIPPSLMWSPKQYTVFFDR